LLVPSQEGDAPVVQMARGARACACDLAGLVVKKTKVLEMEVILIRSSRAQCGCVRVAPALPAAVGMVAFE